MTHYSLSRILIYIVLTTTLCQAMQQASKPSRFTADAPNFIPASCSIPACIRQLEKHQPGAEEDMSPTSPGRDHFLLGIIAELAPIETSIDSPTSSVLHDQESLDNQLLQAALDDDPRGIIKAIISGARVTACEQKFKKTALHLAAQQGNLASIQALRAYHCPIDQSNAIKTTPLMLAAYHGRIDAVDLLLHLGANPKLTNNKGETALTVAASQGHAAIVEMLLRAGADRNHMTLSRETALNKAIAQEHGDVIHVLLRWGAQANSDVSRDRSEEDDDYKRTLGQIEEDIEQLLKSTSPNQPVPAVSSVPSPKQPLSMVHQTEKDSKKLKKAVSKKITRDNAPVTKEQQIHKLDELLKPQAFTPHVPITVETPTTTKRRNKQRSRATSQEEIAPPSTSDATTEMSTTVQKIATPISAPKQRSCGAWIIAQLRKLLPFLG